MKSPTGFSDKCFRVIVLLSLIVGFCTAMAGVSGAAEMEGMKQTQDMKSMQDTKPMQAMKYNGYLADVLCAERGTALDGADMTTHPEKHSVACLKEPQCVASGFGIMIKGMDDKYTFTKFDKKGAELALVLINKTQKKDAVMVEVTGRMKDGVINVESIIEK